MDRPCYRPNWAKYLIFQGGLQICPCWQQPLADWLRQNDDATLPTSGKPAGTAIPARPGIGTHSGFFSPRPNRKISDDLSRLALGFFGLTVLNS